MAPPLDAQLLADPLDPPISSLNWPANDSVTRSFVLSQLVMRTRRAPSRIY